MLSSTSLYLPPSLLPPSLPSPPFPPPSLPHLPSSLLPPFLPHSLTSLLPSFLPSSLTPLTDLDEGRLQVAKAMGATHVVKVTTKDSRALAKQISDILGCKPDQSIECSGAEPSIATAIYVGLGVVCTEWTAISLVELHEPLVAILRDHSSGFNPLL